MNQVTLMGRLTKDPVLTYNNSTGSGMCRFTLAVDRRLTREKKQEMEANNQPTADFIGCVCWGKLAESVNNYTAKGKRVLVEGRIQTGSYTAKDGTRRYTTDVVCSNVQFIDWKDRSYDRAPQASSPSPYPQNRAAQSPNQGSGEEAPPEEEFFGDDFSPVDDDRIPF